MVGRALFLLITIAIPVTGWADAVPSRESDLLKWIVRLAGIALFASIMPITAWSYYRFRLPRKKDEFEQVLQILELDPRRSSLWSPTIKTEYSISDYALPVIFATFVTAVNAALLVLAEDLQMSDRRTLLFSMLPCQHSQDPKALPCDVQYILVLSMAFLGAYVWSLRSLFRRLVTVDLPPAAYYGFSIRLILSPFIALLFAYLVPDKLQMAVPLPVIAFFCGIYPEHALNYLVTKTRIFALSGGNRAADLPLEMVEGISPFHQARLNEVGVDNAQNLAEANLVELIVRTPFKPPVLIDWIAQAKLYVTFKADVVKLRSVGIRTALDLRQLGQVENNLVTLAKVSGIDETFLANAYTLIASDPALLALGAAASKFGSV